MARVHPTPAAVPLDASSRTVLKRGRFGTVSRIPARGDGEAWLVERDTGTAGWGLRALARRLAAREARVLTWLAGVPGVPRLAEWDGRCLRRSWLEGAPLQAAQPRDRAYFREALRLVRRMHAVGVANNDLARASSWLVTDQGRPGVIEFGYAKRVGYRGRRFRALAHADLRDLLAHKRSHCGDALTARQRALLARRPSWIERAWLRLARRQGSIVSKSSVGVSPGRK